MKWQILEVKNGVNKGWVGFRGSDEYIGEH